MMICHSVCAANWKSYYTWQVLKRMAGRRELLPGVSRRPELERVTQGPVVHWWPRTTPGCSRAVVAPSHRAPVPTAPLPFNFMYCNALNWVSLSNKAGRSGKYSGLFSERHPSFTLHQSQIFRIMIHLLGPC